jgi:hypothetical protein
MAVSVTETRQIPSTHRPKETKDEQIINFAKSTFYEIQALPRGEPSENIRNKTAIRINKWLQKVPEHLKLNCWIIGCKREILAFKLGVESEVLTFDENRGFERFASKPPLASYLAEYNHTIKLSSKREIQLQKEGTYTNWTELKPLVQIPERDPKTNQPWLYGPEGIQNKNMFEWDTLKPYKQEDPALWDHQYIFEFCCCCVDIPQFIGDHSWLRLKTPTGDIYCVGLYRPYKHDPKLNYKFPMRTQKGHLMQPDVSEFWGLPIHRLSFAITEEQFLTMKETIERDKRQDEQIFQLIGQNCTQYVEKIGEIGKIRLPTEKPFWELLNKRYGHPCIQTGAKAAAATLPARISNFFAGFNACIWNSVLFCAGTNRVDPQVAHQNIPPHLESCTDCCNPEKLMLKHPFTVGHDTEEYVEQWRDRNGASSNRKIQFACPPMN